MTETTYHQPEPAEPTNQAPAQAEYPLFAPALPAQAPKKRRFGKAQILLAGVGVAGLLVGFFGGVAGSAARLSTCSQAIDYANEGFHIASETIGYATDGIKAASRFSISDMESASEDMKDSSGKLGDLAPKYREASALCKGQ